MHTDFPVWHVDLGVQRKGTSAHARDPRKATQAPAQAQGDACPTRSGAHLRHGMAVARTSRSRPEDVRRPGRPRPRLRLPGPRVRRTRRAPLRPRPAGRDDRRAHGALVVGQPAHGPDRDGHRRRRAVRAESAGRRRGACAGGTGRDGYAPRPGRGDTHPLVAAGGPVHPGTARRTALRQGLGAQLAPLPRRGRLSGAPAVEATGGQVRWERAPLPGSAAPWLPDVEAVVDALVEASTSAPDGGSRLAY